MSWHFRNTYIERFAISNASTRALFLFSLQCHYIDWKCINIWTGKCYVQDIIMPMLSWRALLLLLLFWVGVWMEDILKALEMHIQLCRLRCTLAPCIFIHNKITESHMNGNEKRIFKQQKQWKTKKKKKHLSIRSTRSSIPARLFRGRRGKES